MPLMPEPMISAPNSNCHSGSRGWLTSHRAKPQDRIEISSDKAVSWMS